MTDTAKAAPAKAEGTKVRVLKKGEGKISKGIRIGGESQYFAKSEEVVLPDDIAISLEDRGLVEIL